MATPDQVASAYQRRQAQIATAATRAAVKQFNHLDEHALSESWAAGGGANLTRIVGQAQLTAASEAAPYLADLAAAQGVAAGRLLAAAVVADALSGIASDGRPLMSLLFLPVLLVKRLISGGAKLGDALAQGRRMTVMLAGTQVADAGRAAVTVGMTADPGWVSYVRILRLPSCARCIILAGREYRWSEGFARHPVCDCYHLAVHRDSPERLLAQTPAEVFESLTREDQDKVFGKAGAESIRLGANPGQVVNARKGMKTATVYGRQAQVTTTGTTSRAHAGRRLIEQGARTQRQAEEFATRLTREGPEQRRLSRRRVMTPRLMPEEILRAANGDRDEAVRLLYRFGYLI
jgi:hypothetical protein